MITLKNININFNGREIIEDSEITIEDGAITAITGKSGTGKTSLLYLFGLLTSNQSYEYYFDGTKIDTSDDEIISYYKKNKIGFIFQENSLIDDLTVYDNIKLAAKIAGRKVTNEEIEHYIEYVDLKVDKKIYPKQLSTGEQQRVAIACAIAKNPDLIIADEPTSALDNENTKKIMGIFKKFANNKEKKVIIVSHDESVCKEADIIYKIIDKKIIKEKNSCVNSNIKVIKGVKEIKSKFDFKFYLDYVKRTIRKKKLSQRLIMLFLSAVAIAFTISIQVMGDGLIANQSDILNLISDREIFMVNLTAPIDEEKDIDENISIKKHEYEQILNISGIDKLYPYYEFRNRGYDIEKQSYIKETSIKVTTDTENKSEFYSDIVIVPYYEEQSIDKQLDVEFENKEKNDIYISYSLARTLGIESKDKDITIDFDIGIPVSTTNTTLYMGNGATYSADVDVSKVVLMTLDISGIVSSNYSNRYSASGNKIIYMPILMMDDYIKQVQSSFEYGNVSHIELNEWNPSAYVVYAKNYNEVSMVVEKIKGINSNFVAVCDYQDINSMNSMLENIKQTALSIAWIVLFIVLVLMTVIYINYILGRKYEIALLKANGLTRNELCRLLLTEIAIHVFIITIVGCVVSFIISNLVNFVFSFNVLSLTISSYICIFCISVIVVMIPSICSIIIMNRVHPDKVMRD